MAKLNQELSCGGSTHSLYDQLPDECSCNYDPDMLRSHNLSSDMLLTESYGELEPTNVCSVMLTNLMMNDYSVLAQPRCEIGPKLILDGSALLKPFSTCDIRPRLDKILLKNINEMNVF